MKSQRLGSHLEATVAPTSRLANRDCRLADEAIVELQKGLLDPSRDAA
jgi:hypothetical protein